MRLLGSLVSRFQLWLIRSRPAVRPALAAALMPLMLWLAFAPPAPGTGISMHDGAAHDNGFARNRSGRRTMGEALRLAARPIARQGRMAQTPARFIRVGLTTRGAAIALWPRSPIVVTDALQPGRRLTARSGEVLTFFHGANQRIAARGQIWSGPISIRSGSGVFTAWRAARVDVADGPTHVSTDGADPRWQRAYRGSFEIAPQGYSFEPAAHRGPLRLVNMLPLDEYLKGVVPWEMTPSAPLEALKAQAICARSETLAKIAGGRHARDGYDICDYDHCQGYSGTENEKPASSLAVEQTAGLAIFHRGRIADAVYATNSGGVTAGKDDIWRGPPAPHLQSVRDVSPARHPVTARLLGGRMSEAAWTAYCTQNLPSYAQPSQSETAALAARRRRDPRAAALFQPGDLPEFYRWTRLVSAAQMTAAMSARVRLQTGGVSPLPPPLQNVTAVRVLERAPSGRIKRLQVLGLAGNPSAALPSGAVRPIMLTFEKDSQIRAMLSGRLGSTTALPSSIFVVLPRRDARGRATAWVFRGAGWGHGAGMCQRGAQNHAREGWDARRIIQWYFRGVEVRAISG